MADDEETRREAEVSPAGTPPLSDRIQTIDNDIKSPATSQETDFFGFGTPPQPPSPTPESLMLDEGELPPSIPTTPIAADDSPAPKQLPVKPVLGKEKAKQRLKAIGNQKKIQMDARNNITPKTPKNRRENGSSGKKNKKSFSPHEKAQITINEIEVMKREEERAQQQQMFFDESMIHHIQADSVDDGRSSNAMAATTSLEAIKGYDNEDDKRDERRRSRIKPEAYRSAAMSRRRLDFNRSRRQRAINENRSGRKSDRKSRKRDGRSPASRKEGRRRNRRYRTKDRSGRPQSFINRPGHDRADLFRPTDIIRYTKTQPVLSFAVNAAAIAARLANLKAKAKERRKQKARDKEKKLLAKTTEEIDVPKKVRKKRTSREGGRKKKKKRTSKPKRRLTCTPLSFNADDLIFEEEIDDFPLAKDGVEVDEELPPLLSLPPPPRTTIEFVESAAPELEAFNEETIVAPASFQPAVATFSPSPLPAIEAAAIEDKSPDTDDYMPNWEEEEEDSSKDETPLFPLRKEAFACASNEPMSELTITEANTNDESSTESIKDGLGTPIFVNPSPPDEFIANMSFQADMVSHIVPATENQQPDDNEESSTPPPRREPFAMQGIYEEFLHSMPKETDSVHRKVKTASSEDVESGFMSSSTMASISLPDDANSSSSTSSSSSSSSGSVHEQPSGYNSAQKKPSSNPRRTTVRREEITENIMLEPTSSSDEASESEKTLSVTSDDLKKLRSLQKRRSMLKMIRKQSDGMDEEDRQCLLGLEKLIRAERRMLLRNDAIKQLHLKEKIMGSDSDENLAPDDGHTSYSRIHSTRLLSDTETKAAPVGIFDTNREAIKLTIASKNQSPVKKMQATPTNASLEDTSGDDQDFTEKLKRTVKEETKSSSESEVANTGSSATLRGRKRGSRTCRSLSSTPIRRIRSSLGRSGRRDRRAYSPSPNRSSKRKSRGDHKTSRRRRSRSPGQIRAKRFSRSPLYRPASPPPQQSSRNSRSLSKERKSRSCSPTVSSIVSSYPGWNMDRYSQYYINDSYYYPAGPRGPPLRASAPIGSGDHSNSPQSRYPNPYHTYAQYNMYANEYMNVAGYQHSSYPEPSFQVGPHTPPPTATVITAEESPGSYSTIPVLESSAAAPSSGNYYDYSSRDFENASPVCRKDDDANNGTIHSNNKELLQHDDKSGKSSMFAVQKGNVLEIVPAATVVVVKQEPIDDPGGQLVAIKQEFIVPEESSMERAPSAKDDDPVDVKPIIKQSRRGNSWKDEVARRHVVSAVMRLNKETDDSLRGILRNRANSSVPSKEKKKVLFADGIPPGHTSSGSSDEEATLKYIRRRLKKKQRRLASGNKENRQAIFDTFVEAKIDPELWDAPPPPPPSGSPPGNLTQPILIRPASPEELLYFHFDPVYNMMYVSPMETPIPPRLLDASGKTTTVKVVQAADTGPSENGGTSPPKLVDTVATSSPTDNFNSPPATPNDSTRLRDGRTPSPPPPPPPNDETLPLPQSPEQPPPNLPSESPPPRPPTPPTNPPPPSSPPQQIQNIVSMRMNAASPASFNQLPPQLIAASPGHQSFDIPPQQQLRPSPPVMVGYPGQIYNRSQQRIAGSNMMRGPYNMLPPPQHRSFNPHIPPPFGGPGSGGFPMSPNDCPPPSQQQQQQPQQQYNPNAMVMFNSQHQQQPPLPQQQQQQQQQPPAPQNFMYNMPPHMMMAAASRSNRFSSAQQFIHPVERSGSPRIGSPVFRHLPPLRQQPQNNVQKGDFFSNQA